MATCLRLGLTFKTCVMSLEFYEGFIAIREKKKMKVANMLGHTLNLYSRDCVALVQSEARFVLKSFLLKPAVVFHTKLRLRPYYEVGSIPNEYFFSSLKEFISGPLVPYNLDMIPTNYKDYDIIIVTAEYKAAAKTLGDAINKLAHPVEPVFETLTSIKPCGYLNLILG